MFRYHEPRPQQGQRRRRLILSFSLMSTTRAEHLAACAERKELLRVAADYCPARASYDDATFNLKLSTDDEVLIDTLWSYSLPVVPKVKRPTKEGCNLEPEAIAATAEWIANNAQIRIAAAHLEPEYETAFRSDGKVRDGFIVLELDGAVFERWIVPRRVANSTTHPVFRQGQITGYAGTEVGADRTLSGTHTKPEHGWKLRNTCIGHMWFPRSADDVAHRLREVRRLAEPLAEACDKLRGLDLSEEPELARELAELLTALGRGGQADSIARMAGVPAPRGR